MKAGQLLKVLEAWSNDLPVVDVYGAPILGGSTVLELKDALGALHEDTKLTNGEDKAITGARLDEQGRVMLCTRQSA